MSHGCRHELFLNLLKDPWIKRPWPSRVSYTHFLFFSTPSLAQSILNIKDFFFSQKPIVFDGNI